MDRIFLRLLHVTGVTAAEKLRAVKYRHVLQVLENSPTLSAQIADDVASLGAGPKSRTAQLLLCAPLTRPDPLT